MSNNTTGSQVSWLPKGGPARTMVVVLGASISAVLYSHYAQVRDRQVMKAGVQRDKERLKQLRRQRKKEQEQRPEQ